MYGDGWVPPKPTYGILHKFGSDIQRPDPRYARGGVFMLDPPAGMATQIIDAHQFGESMVLVGIVSEETQEMRPPQKTIFVTMLDAQGRPQGPFGTRDLFTIGTPESRWEPTASLVTQDGHLLIAAYAKDSSEETKLFRISLSGEPALKEIPLRTGVRNLSIHEMIEASDGNGRTRLVVSATDKVPSTNYIMGTAERSLLLNVELDAAGDLLRAAARLLPFDPRSPASDQEAQLAFSSGPTSLVQVAPDKFLMLASLFPPNKGNPPASRAAQGSIIAMLNRDGTLDKSFADQGRLFLKDGLNGGNDYSHLAAPAFGQVPLLGWVGEKATLWLLNLADGSLRQVDQFRTGLNPAAMLRRRNAQGEEELIVGTHLYAQDTYPQTAKMPIIRVRSYVLKP